MVIFQSYDNLLEGISYLVGHMDITCLSAKSISVILIIMMGGSDILSRNTWSYDNNGNTDENENNDVCNIWYIHPQQIIMLWSSCWVILDIMFWYTCTGDHNITIYWESKQHINCYPPVGTDVIYYLMMIPRSNYDISWSYCSGVLSRRNCWAGQQFNYVW